MDELLSSIASKKEQLDAGRPLSGKALANLEHYYDIELTYTSNAIEGNTLSAVETTLVIEKGITVGGKPLKDHLEALDHYDAIRYVRELALQKRASLESDVRNLHRLVMHRSAPEIAGQYANLPRYVRTETGRFTFPSPVEIPALMGDFARWMSTARDTPETAFQAHLHLVTIHPFSDGNGRTARLLMNLFLLRGGYPPIAVRPEDRLDYLRSLQQQQAGLGSESFDTLLYRRLDATLDDYLRGATAITAGRYVRASIRGNRMKVPFEFLRSNRSCCIFRQAALARLATQGAYAFRIGAYLESGVAPEEPPHGL